MFEALSDFQQDITNLKPVAPRLVEVLQAAMPAFEQGFSYTASHWSGELTVTLHFQGAELGSSAKACLSNYGETCARLLAGLLGIPLLDGDEASEPEPLEPVTVACGLKPPQTVTVACGLKPPQAAAEAPEPPADDQADEADETDEEFGDGLDGSPSQPTTPDTQRELTEQEKATAIDMIKVMPPSQRKAFTKAFRELFAVPADAKQISPYILRLEHWLFIDRYTVEAAGGVAA